MAKRQQTFQRAARKRKAEQRHRAAVKAEQELVQEMEQQEQAQEPQPAAPAKASKGSKPADESEAAEE
jgi:hypothetical protein